jgi:hypothetical protein
MGRILEIGINIYNARLHFSSAMIAINLEPHMRHCRAGMQRIQQLEINLVFDLQRMEVPRTASLSLSRILLCANHSPRLRHGTLSIYPTSPPDLSTRTPDTPSLALT